MIKKSIMCVIMLFAIGFTAISGYAQQTNELHSRDFWRSQPTVEDIQKKINEGHSPTEMTSGAFDATSYAILENNSLENIKFLLSQGNDVNKITHDARTYMFWAAYRGNLEVMEFLKDEGARFDLLDDAGRSVLMFAAVTGQTDKAVYEFLKDSGFDLKTERDRGGLSALLAVARRVDDFEIIEYFLNEGLSIHDTDNNGNGIFHYAAQVGNVETLKKLVSDYKVSYSLNSKTNENAFHFATRRTIREDDPSPLPLYKYLESLSLDPSAVTNSSQNALHNLAFRSNDIELFRYFIEKGTDPALVDENGNTPLINASSRGSKEKVELLLSHISDVNHKNNDGITSITRAIRTNSLEVVELLQANGADLSILDNQGYDLGYHLADATRNNLDGFSEKMNFLIGHNYDPKAVQKDGSTLLHVVIDKKNIDFLKLLLDMDLNINAKDSNGQTILHHAAMQAENETLLKFLLAVGADKEILTEFEESAYDLALENEMLSEHSVNIDFLKPVSQ